MLLSARAGRSAILVLTLGLAGFLFATSATSAHSTDIRAERRTQLTDLIKVQQKRVDTGTKKVERLRGQVDTLTKHSASEDSRVAAQQQRVDAVDDPAGLTDVIGPAVEVTLSDAPVLKGGLPQGVSPDDVVVHQQDVQAVVNALWSGGAEAMTLMDQRVISTSAVRCVGNTLILQGRVYSPPYVVTAIGDPERLKKGLEESPQVAIYRQYVDRVHLGYKVTTKKDVRMPAYEGALTLRYGRAMS